jgi:sugar phosphate isomerase/epimerase
MALRLAVATEDFGSSLKKSIAQASKCPVSGLRLNSRTEVPADRTTDSAFRQIAQYIHERQMQVAGLICPTRHALYDAEYLEERIALIRSSMSVARKLHTDQLIVRCGRIPDPEQAGGDQAKAEPVSIDDAVNPFSLNLAGAGGQSRISPGSQFGLLCEILNELTQYGTHVGCTLCLHLASYDIRLIRQLFSQVRSGPLRLAFDPATVIMTGGNVVGLYRDLYKECGYIRARDALRDVDGGGVEVAVGDGIADWTELLPTLEEADYSGWVCVERTGGDHRGEDVVRGVSHLKALIPHAVD